MSRFIFDSKAQTDAGLRFLVPAGIESKAVLLDRLSAALNFPGYFGRNWDAFEECMRDLSWLPGGDVILRHDDLPLSQDLASLSIYLSILKNAAEKWNADGERKLIVIFPPDTESVVLDVLSYSERISLRIRDP